MNGHPSLASLLESFFRHRLTKQRNASPSTIASYRDALRLLILFAAERTGRKPSSLEIKDIDRDVILAFLDELEQKREEREIVDTQCATRRDQVILSSCRCERTLRCARRRAARPGHPNQEVAHRDHAYHLPRSELDVSDRFSSPDQRTPRGRRDRTLLLFMARTGARVSEVLSVDARDLELEQPRPQVLLRGKGRKERIVPDPARPRQSIAGFNARTWY